MTSPLSLPHKTVEIVTDTFGIVLGEKGEQKQIKRFTWKNSNRVQVQVITLGATITSVKFPNKKGIVDDVVLGFDDPKGYLDNHDYNFGSTLGRYASFIKNSHFNLMKRDFTLNANVGKHHYNGGVTGFDRIIWNHYVAGNKVVLSHLSPDKNEGYPGDLLVFAVFELTTSNEFKIEYKATTSKPTIINISNHCFFNLSGHSTGSEEIKKHVVMINADCHTITGEDMLPTGEIQSVLNTVYDFQIPVVVGSLLSKLDGFNKNFCINRGVDQSLNFVARVHHPPSGRILEIYSNQSGIQFDTANTLPERTEYEVTCLKPAKSPYIKCGVATFDMLDEIYNKVVDAMAEDRSKGYSDILALIQDLQKKEKTIYRNSSFQDNNSIIKRSSLNLDNLITFNITSLQRKFLERILKEIDKLENQTPISHVKQLIENVVVNSKLTGSSSSNYASEKYRSPDVAAFANTIRGKKGARYNKNSCISFQCQNYPDAINNNNFPSCVLKPGAIYSNVIVYKFWVKSDQSGVTGIL